MPENGDQTYRFGPFRLEPRERRLLRDGQAVALTPKAFDTLVILVERAGHLVEKEELMKALWPDSFVEEGNISQYVWTLRKTLGEAESGDVFIETVPRKGFRFVIPVTVHNETDRDLVVKDETDSLPSKKRLAGGAKAASSLEEPRTIFSPNRLSRHSLRLGIVAAIIAFGILGLVLIGLSRKRKGTTAGSHVRTLAVLPFKPLSADSRDESLEMGMAETLITRLSNLRQIVVRPMSATRKYTDPQQDPIKAGQELQAEAVLDGSIQKSGDRIRVTVRLRNVQSGASLWAEQFDENFTDIFKVQDSISDRVTDALLVKLSGDEQQQVAKHYTNNSEAYQLFLQGEHFRDKREYRKSLDAYQRALDNDPNFAQAYIGLAESYNHLTTEGRPPVPVQEAMPKVRAALQRALELDETLPEAHVTLAEVMYEFDYDWVNAEREFKRAIELNPNLPYARMGYGWFLLYSVRFDEALRQLERAQEVDPRNLLVQMSVAVVFYFKRDYDQSLLRFQKILEVDPNYDDVFWWMENIYQQKGMYAEALEYAMKSGIKNGKLKPEEAEGRREILRKAGWQGILKLWLSKQEARVAKNEAVSTRLMAVLQALLGNKDQAFRWLAKGIDEHDPFALWLKIEPQYESLRSDPRYTTLLKRLNMPP